ncbi:hypothetical protein P3T22_004744 [Paraburkholderia sp. GAS348]
MKQADERFQSMPIAAQQPRCASDGPGSGAEHCLGESHDRH